MKIVKFLLLLVLLVVVAGLVTAFAVPEIEYTVSVDVDAPPEAVWAAFHDPTQTTTWVEGLESVEHVSGEPLSAGAEYRMVFDEDGRKVVFDETLEVVEAPDRFVFTTTHEMMDMRAETTFEPNDASGTTIESHVTMRGKGLVTRAMMPLMESHIVERQRGDLQRLADLVEGEE